MARVRAVDVPEPSPLFWDHLAARVGEAIAHEPAPAPAPAWWQVPQWGWAAALAVIVVAAGAGYLSSRRPVETPAVVATGGPAVVDPALAPAEPPTDGLDVPDEGWGLIAAMAEESDGAAFAPQAGQSELSIAELSREERAALIDELEAELAPRGGREG